VGGRAAGPQEGAGAVSRSGRRVRFNTLLRLIDRFHREIELCRNAGAYWAGCAVARAAVEAWLVAMTRCFPDRVRRIKGTVAKSWNLAELIDLAEQCGWLSKEGVDAACRIQELGNRIHADRIASGRRLPRMDKRVLNRAERALNTVVSDLYAYITGEPLP
jgi:hypothetical protein